MPLSPYLPIRLILNPLLRKRVNNRPGILRVGIVVGAGAGAGAGAGVGVGVGASAGMLIGNS